MSKSAEKLLKRMIQPNADLRCMTSDAINDPYWSSSSESPSTSISSSHRMLAPESCYLLSSDCNIQQTKLPPSRSPRSHPVLSTNSATSPSTRIVLVRVPVKTAKGRNLWISSLRGQRVAFPSPTVPSRRATSSLKHLSLDQPATPRWFSGRRQTHRRLPPLPTVSRLFHRSRPLGAGSHRRGPALRRRRTKRMQVSMCVLGRLVYGREVEHWRVRMPVAR